MGTSSTYGGPSGRTPLVPSWLEQDGGDPTTSPAPSQSAPRTDGTPLGPVPVAPELQPIPQPALVASRFVAARNNFSRFASSGGSDRGSLGRAISHYVSTSSGGAVPASRRMGSSRRAGAQLLGFLADARARGAREALRALNLEGLAGRPIEEIFLGLADYVCPASGSVDEGIARDAFIETIADLAGLGVTDLDALSAEQMQTVFELYASHAIEARICNDIGAKTLILPTDIRSVERVQGQLRDFIRRGVSDALTAARAAVEALTADRVFTFVTNVYERAFGILKTLGNAEIAR
jgi:hypothetical protein